MELVDNIIINLYSFTLILVISLQARKSVEKNNIQYKLFAKLLRSTSILLIIDIMARFDGNAHKIYPIINEIGNFALFIFTPLIPSLWVLYVYSQIYDNEKNLRKLLHFIYGLNFINLVFTILNPFYNWYYYIDAQNIYYRGPLFLVTVSINSIFIIMSFFLLLKNRRKIERKHFHTLVFFAIPPIVCYILQVVFYGISIVYSGLVVSLLIVYFNIQNHSLYTDYLTGINNRKKLEQYLKEKIDTSTDGKTFSAILIDLNNFKSINDTFGHNEGDNALRVTAKLLTSCLRPNDFIARFGGDEFCIVLDAVKMEHLEKIAARIKASTEKYNANSGKPYKLSFSMGYAIYDNKDNMTLEDFQNKIDMRMYRNKQANKDINIL